MYYIYNVLYIYILYISKITEYGDLNVRPKFFWNSFHKRGILSFHKEKNILKLKYSSCSHILQILHAQ